MKSGEAILRRVWPVLLAVPLLGIAAPARAQARLNAAPGLWEITTSGGPAGPSPLSDADLARLTPQQRAMAQAAMSQLSAPHVIRQCMRQEDIDNAAQRMAGNNQSCKPTVLTSTSTELHVRAECTGQQSGNADIHLLVPDPKTMNGTVHITGNMGGRPMTMHRTLQGRWLSANCGDVQPGRPLIR